MYFDKLGKDEFELNPRLTDEKWQDKYDKLNKEKLMSIPQRELLKQEK